MINATQDRQTYQFVDNQKVMQKALDPTGASVQMTISSEKEVMVKATHESGDELVLDRGVKIETTYNLIGFDNIEIHGPQTNHYAVRCYVEAETQTEFNDGEMAVMEIQPEYNEKLDQAVQRELIKQLMGAGFEQQQVIDILEGVNLEEDDLEFEDGDIPTEAEMNDMIEEARLQALEVPLDPDQQDPGTPPDADDRPSPDPDDADPSEDT